MMNWHDSCGRALVVAGLCATFYSALAEVAVFSVDTNRSVITISGNALGIPLQEQGPGSLTTHFAGTIQADVGGGSIQFLGGSLITALDGGSWAPQTNGSSGNAPANYGVAVSTLPFSADGALRNLQFDLVSPLAGLTNGFFGAGQVAIQFLTNSPTSFDYSFSGLLGSGGGSKSLGGFSTNQVDDRAALTNVGSLQVLAIPLNAEVDEMIYTPGDVVVTLRGQLLATRLLGPALRIASVSVSNQTVTLQWPSVAGQKYQVFSSPDLTTWTPRATDLLANSTNLTWSAAISRSREFFRIAQ